MRQKDAEKRNRDLEQNVGLDLSMPENSIAFVVIKDCLVIKDHLIRDCLLTSTGV